MSCHADFEIFQWRRREVRLSLHTPAPGSMLKTVLEYLIWYDARTGMLPNNQYM